MKLIDKLRLWHRAYRYLYKTERHEIALVRNLIEPGQCVIDIGAHKGAFTYWMAKAAGRDGVVLSFEPNPDLAAYLRDVAGLFRRGQIQVLEYAVSDAIARRKLHFPGRHLGSASLEEVGDHLKPPVEVLTTTLDDYLREAAWPWPISLIKCDVEHHELAAFRGAEHTLLRHKPVLLFESANLRSGGAICGPVFRFLDGLGYEGYFFHGDQLTPLADYDPQRHRVPPLNQNFVFTHRRTVAWRRTRRPYAISRLRERQRVHAA